MADRVFPSTQKDKLGSEREFNGINWDDVVLRLASAPATPAVDPKQLSEDALNAIREKLAEVEDQDSTREAAFPAGHEDKFEKNRFKGKGEKSEDKDEDSKPMEREGCPECGKKPCVCGDKSAATGRRNKILFARAEQLSAEALEAAREEGDDALVQAILAARHDKRVHLAQTIVKASAEQMEKQRRLAKRDNYRMKVVAMAEASQKTAATEKVAATTEGGFKAVTAMTSTERSAWKRQAQAAGFDTDYIEAMLGERTAEASLTTAEEEIRAVMSSDLPENTKKAALTGLVRVAKLTSEQVERQKRYWKEELGYGDQQWIDDLFTNKYE